MQTQTIPTEAYRQLGGLRVAASLAAFVDTEALAGTGIEPARFWTGFADLVATLAPRLHGLLAERDRLQAEIDRWHLGRHGAGHEPEAAAGFLREIGYLVPEPAPFAIETAGLDDEIARMAGPQLVVPATNARYAAERRQRALGQPVRRALRHRCAAADDGAAPVRGHDAERAEEVVRRAALILDEIAPLAIHRSHQEVVHYGNEDGALVVRLADGRHARWSTGRSSSASPATPAIRPASCCATTACTWS